MSEEDGVLARNIVKCAEMCRTLAENGAVLLERVSTLEHVVAVQYYINMPVGSERGRVGSLLSAGHRLRLIPKGTESLTVVAQE